jgi:excisionase family DNA binding protein
MASASNTVSTSQAAALLGTSRVTLLKLVREGKIGYRKNGSRHLIELADIEKFRAAGGYRRDPHWRTRKKLGQSGEKSSVADFVGQGDGG